jgi:dipeptidyl aminopeptidase/acylaminoacyl peptidase
MNRFLLLLTGLLLLLAGAEPSAAVDAPTAEAGRIAAAMVFGDRLVSLNPDGTAAAVLSYAHDTDPAWLGDGGSLAVSSGDSGNGDIFVLSPDGRQRRQITATPERESDPAWAPSGMLAYERGRADTAIYAADAAGHEERLLTDGPGCDGDPAFSPDGMLIAFASCRSGSEQIYLMNRDGTDVVRLTHDDGDDSDPAWSPDGSRIAYSSARGDSRRIYLIGADGSDDRPLTAGPADVSPVWSPDGRELLYIAALGDYIAFGLSLETGEERVITRGVARIAWQRIPNGERACTHLGTWQDDVVGGGTGSDLVCGAGGNDHVNGGPGLDILRGGDGDDALDARDGVPDVVDGGEGWDTAFVDRGDRTVHVENISFPEPRNVARGRPVTTTWSWADSSAEFVVDGLGPTSPLWWGSYYAPQWIEIELVRPTAIRSIQLVVAQSPSGETIHAIRGRTATGERKLLRVVNRVTHDNDVITIRPIRPWRGITAVRISTVESPSWVAWKEIRVLR